MNVLVVSDTHVPDHARALPPALGPHLEWADQILHAGDLTSADVLTELQAYAPVHAVIGNMDGWDVREMGLSEQLQVTLAGVAVGMVHDSGSRAGREARLRRRFPEASVIVFGHSHMPVNDVYEGVLYLNPGSPTWKRRAAWPSAMRVVVGDDGIDAKLIRL